MNHLVEVDDIPDNAVVVDRGVGAAAGFGSGVGVVVGLCSQLVGERDLQCGVSWWARRSKGLAHAAGPESASFGAFRNEGGVIVGLVREPSENREVFPDCPTGTRKVQELNRRGPDPSVDSTRLRVVEPDPRRHRKGVADVGLVALEHQLWLGRSNEGEIEWTMRLVVLVAACLLDHEERDEMGWHVNLVPQVVLPTRPQNLFEVKAEATPDPEDVGRRCLPIPNEIPRQAFARVGRCSLRPGSAALWI
mmetsp:Transcript_24348/g.64227  ORF Transcript_24348/g.64227 Transcript_24348/m.64227 type:complete len:249 (+) Transcript_24348:2130-2876(+)